MVRLFRRSVADEPIAVAVEVRPAPPADPVELGLLLRTARERRDLRLEDVRDLISVPLVDLDALERGRLEMLHTQQAAVIALWRYSEHLGLDPAELVGVLRSHWPNRGLSVDAFISPRGVTPIAELQVATRLLLPIATPGPLANRALGLSDATKAMLDSGSAKQLFALKVLAPTSAVRRARLADAAAAAVEAIEQAERPFELETGFEEDDVADDPASSAEETAAAPLELEVVDAEAATAIIEAEAVTEEELVPVEEAEEDAFGLVSGQLFEAPEVAMAPEPGALAEEPATEVEPPAITSDAAILVSLDAWREPETVAVSIVPPVVELLVDEPSVVEPPVVEPAFAETPVAEEPLNDTLAPAALPLPPPVTAESQRRWGQHLARFLVERLGLAPEQDEGATPDTSN